MKFNKPLFDLLMFKSAVSKQQHFYIKGSFLDGLSVSDTHKAYFCWAFGLTAPTLLSLYLSHPLQCSRSPRTPVPAPFSLKSSLLCQTWSLATAVATFSLETTWQPKSGTSTWRASPWRHTRCVNDHAGQTRGKTLNTKKETPHWNDLPYRANTIKFLSVK